MVEPPGELRERFDTEHGGVIERLHPLKTVCLPSWLNTGTKVQVRRRLRLSRIGHPEPVHQEILQMAVMQCHNGQDLSLAMGSFAVVHLASAWPLLAVQTCLGSDMHCGTSRFPSSTRQTSM